MRAFGWFVRERFEDDTRHLARAAGAGVDGRRPLTLIGAGRTRAIVRADLPGVTWYAAADGSFAITDGEVFAIGADRAPAQPGAAASAILHAVRRDGAAALRALNGTAAVMVWDAPSGRLALASDRAGYGLCFWMESAGAIFFGSDILSLIRSDPRTSLNEAAVDLFLAGGFISAPWTSLAHVHKVPAGHVLIADRRAATLTQYWRPTGRPRIRVRGAPLKQLQQQALLKAVERQLPGSGRPALLLSSGIDSMYLGALLARKFQVRPVAFTYRYADYHGPFNEAEGARIAARTLGLEHHEMPVRLADILSRLRPMLIDHGGPFSYGAHSAILRDVAASGATVVYNGLEPDAPYCSPSEFIGQRLRALPLPHAAVAAAIERTCGADRRWARALANAERVAATGLVWRFHAPLSPDPVRRSLYLDPGTVERCKRAASLLFADVIREYADEPPVVRVGGPLMRLYGSEGSNRWSACFGRAHGLLPRSPLLDADYVDLMHRFPWDGRKQLLRELAAELLGPELAWWPKIGQTLPINDWLRGPLSGLFAAELSRARIAAGGLFRHDAIEGLLHRHMAGVASHAWTLWNVIAITTWQEIVREEAGKHLSVRPLAPLRQTAY
jgi:asparagine synthase (glutamine-hydrolysing)